MSAPDYETALWAIDVLRRYAPDPIADEQEYQAARMRDESERDAELREEEPARRDYESDEQFFLEQQCPSESNFR